MSFSTNDALIPPVSEQEVAEFARLDDDDPTIRGSLIVATSLVISYLKRDLINREYTLRIKDFYEGKYDRGIYKKDKAVSLKINLPMANLFELKEVYINNVLSEDYNVDSGKQSAITLNNLPASTTPDDDDIVVNYIAGYGYSKDDVPEDIKQAVIMLAAYLNIHRVCSPSDALMMSGAKDLLSQHAVMGGFVI